MAAFIRAFVAGLLITDIAGIIACLILFVIYKFMEKLNDEPAPEIFWRDLHSMFRLFTFGLYKKIPL